MLANIAYMEHMGNGKITYKWETHHLHRFLRYGIGDLTFEALGTHRCQSHFEFDRPIFDFQCTVCIIMYSHVYLHVTPNIHFK